MKTYTRTLKDNARWWLAFTSILAVGGLGAVAAEDPTDRPEVATLAVVKSGGGAVATASGENGLSISSIEPPAADGAVKLKDQAWLGVSIEECSEALTSQLGLPAGAGLVVTYVVPDSPAAKAGLGKNDVLAELDGQLLVVPAQLRKLIRVHKQGDTVNLAFYRAGKKQTASATLGKVPKGFSFLEDGHPLDGEPGRFLLPFGSHTAGQQMKAFGDALGNVKIDTAKVQEEVRHSMEQARQALQEAWHATTNVAWAPAVKALKELSRAGIDVNNNASVTVRSTGQRVKSVVKADESGTIVLVSNPKPYLTAHDKDGKLLFDGEIDTPEQRAKVPPELWEKVEPLLDKVAPKAEEEPGTQAN